MGNRAAILGEIRRSAWMGAAILVLFCLIGEAVFRLPFAPGLLAFEYDAQLGWRLEPDQRGSLFLGNMSRLSAPITINRDGYRNGPLDWSAPKVLCLGSSEVLGTGVGDEEVWTARLTDMLRADGRGMEAVNAGGPAFGPYHAAIQLDRFLGKAVPGLVVVRVSLGDRNFLPPTERELADLRAGMERKRVIQSFSKFLPFLFNKAKAQAESIREVFRGPGPPLVFTAGQEKADAGERMWAKQEGHWRAIAGRCVRDSIPLVFLIDDPLDSEAGRLLEERFRSALGRDGVGVLRMDGAAFGLAGETPEDRRKDYRKRYTLGYDPHANPAKHERLAGFLRSSLRGLLPDGKPALPEVTAVP